LVHQDLPDVYRRQLGSKPWPGGIGNRGQPSCPDPRGEPQARPLAQPMAAGELQDEGPQDRFEHLVQAPLPAAGVPWIRYLNSRLLHSPLTKELTDAFAQGSIAHSLTPGPAESAGKDIPTPYCTGLVRCCQPYCEYAAPMGSHLPVLGPLEVFHFPSLFHWEGLRPW
jgi:hypothetical protein